MDKNLTTSQLTLIAIAAILLLIASFAFYLLQDPEALLPFIPASNTSTFTPIPVSTETAPASTPTRRTSYTPLAAFLTPQLGTPTELPTEPENPSASPATPLSSQTYPGPSIPSGTATTPRPSSSATIAPTGLRTPSPTSKTPSSTPTATQTHAPGEVGVTGRIIQDGLPVEDVKVTFADDVAPRQSLTNPGGHYSFTTLAPGTSFSLTFKSSENPDLTPQTEISSLIVLEGTLPTGVDPIDFPDLDISININGDIFLLLVPEDGDSTSASAINDTNYLQYVWSLYTLGGSYHVELGRSGSDDPIWTSPTVNDTNYMWDGTLDDTSHITQGTYWWRVSVTRALGNYSVIIYTQPYDIVFTP